MRRAARSSLVVQRRVRAARPWAARSIPSWQTRCSSKPNCSLRILVTCFAGVGAGVRVGSVGVDGDDRDTQLVAQKLEDVEPEVLLVLVGHGTPHSTPSVPCAGWRLLVYGPVRALSRRDQNHVADLDLVSVGVSPGLDDDTAARREGEIVVVVASSAEPVVLDEGLVVVAAA